MSLWKKHKKFHIHPRTLSSLNRSSLSFCHMLTWNNSVTEEPATLRQTLISLMTYYFSEVMFVNRRTRSLAHIEQTLKVTRAFFPSIHSILQLDIMAAWNRIKAPHFKSASAPWICGINGFAALRGCMFPRNLSINRLWQWYTAQLLFYFWCRA